MIMDKQSVITLRKVVKSFPGVKALKGFDLEIYRNEILGLVGENGAGKSTLMKVLIGMYQLDSGSMTLRGEKISLKDPQQAIYQGIGMVFQEGGMIPNLTIAENLYICHEQDFRSRGLISNKRMNEAAKEALAHVGLDISPSTAVSKLTAAQKQMVEIARLLLLCRMYGRENPILILDEPTTVLLEKEVKTLFRILKEIKKEATIILISHRLEEVIENSDRIVVLKDGDLVTEMPSSEADIPIIEQLMVGRELTEEHYRESEQLDIRDEVCFSVENLGIHGKFEPLSFNLRKGEIVSLVGLIGSGKEELCSAIAGVEKADQGKISVGGKVAHINSPKDSIIHKIGYIPIDRRKQGLATDMDVSENINLLVLDRFTKGGILNLKKERENAAYWAEKTRVKTPSLKQKCGNLSGGNQQKVVLSKWLTAASEVLLLEHPTRGIDVGAKDEIYHHIRELAKSGKAMLIMCDTLEEDIGLCNRMIIMKDGRFVKELECPRENKPTPADIISLIV
jgi:ribose transport system ATP-binding protein